jgi:hypothetical protein
VSGSATTGAVAVGVSLSSYTSSRGLNSCHRSIQVPWMSGWEGSRASALTAFSTLAVNWREPSSD